MDRVQKKCFLGSAGVHLLLIVVLFIGPAFLPSKVPPSETFEVLEFIPFKTTDAMASGGGNPNAKPAAAPLQPQQQPPAQQPEPKREPPAPEPKREPEPEPKAEPRQPIAELKHHELARRQPEPEPEPASAPKPDPDALEPLLKKSKLPEVSTKLVTRTGSSTAAKQRAEARQRAIREQEAQYAANRRRISESIGRVAENLGNGLSSGTSVELKGPGGGGVPYANFLQAVMSVYDRAWVPPTNAEDSEAITVASVTIARDGTVLNAKITRPSGNAEVDRSVQATLYRVKYAAPLPDDAKEDQRTVTINFRARPNQARG